MRADADQNRDLRLHRSMPVLRVRRLLVYRRADQDEPIVLINPELTELSDELETDTEGCLSLPGITDKVDRPLAIALRAQDLTGKPFELEAEDYLARAICHEVDHLDGILFTDHLRGLRKERVRRQLKKLAAEQEVAV